VAQQHSGLGSWFWFLLMQFAKVGENMKFCAVRLFTLSFLLLTLFAVGAYADSVNLGTAGSYAVLAGSTVTNTGTSVLNGDLGLSPGSSITGFPPGIVNGTVNATNAAAEQAQDDLTTAYKQAKNLSSTKNLTGQNLGGQLLGPGVYHFNSSAQLTGQLILQGKPGSVFVFQINSTLTTASASSVIFLNSLGKQMKDPNIFWQVGSSATLGTGTKFEGNILALSSITLTTGATIKCGSALARNGAVTLDTNVITNCGTISTVPEPGTMGLMGTGLAILAGAVRRKMRI
jgi:Ice-binding-like/PEP-CTERM motif